MGLIKRVRRYKKIRQEAPEDKEFHEERDRKENERSRLPENEKVEIPAIWVAELYTPSTIDGLLKGLSTLNWKENLVGKNQDLSSWTKENRLGSSYSWTSLGLVSPTSNPHLMSDRVSPLPKGVKAAFPKLVAITPSITALCVGFILEDEESASLTPILKKNHSTTIKKKWRMKDTLKYILFGSKTNFVRTIYDPGSKRIHKSKEIIREQEKNCENWIRKYLPGAFSNSAKLAFPTATLLVTEEVMPLSEESKRIDAFQGLSLNQYFDAWRPNDWDRARMVLPRGANKEGYRLTFACRRRDAFSNNNGDPDPGSNWSLGYRAGEHIMGFLPLWALSRLLDLFQENLSTLRDTAPQDNGRRPIRNMRNFQSILVSEIYDIGVCSEEIIDFTKRPKYYSFYSTDMEYTGVIGPSDRNLLNDLRIHQRKTAKNIVQQNQLLKSLILASSNLSLSISNARMQIWIILLTLVSLFISVKGASLFD